MSRRAAPEAEDVEPEYGEEETRAGSRHHQREAETQEHEVGELMLRRHQQQGRLVTQPAEPDGDLHEGRKQGHGADLGGTEQARHDGQ